MDPSFKRLQRTQSLTRSYFRTETSSATYSRSLRNQQRAPQQTMYCGKKRKLSHMKEGSGSNGRCLVGFQDLEQRREVSGSCENLCDTTQKVPLGERTAPNH